MAGGMAPRSTVIDTLDAGMFPTGGQRTKGGAETRGKNLEDARLKRKRTDDPDSGERRGGVHVGLLGERAARRP